MASLTGAQGGKNAKSYWTDRLTRFYQKYNPDKVSSVAATLKKYKGHEMKLFTAMVQKYGPEPEADKKPQKQAPKKQAPKAESEDEKEPTNPKKESGSESGSGSGSSGSDSGSSSGSGSDSDSDEEDETADKGSMQGLDSSDWPCTVPLCPSCGLPYEYCEYSMTAKWSECLPNLLKARPNMMLQKKEKTVQQLCDESGTNGGSSAAGSSGATKGETKEPAIDPNDPRAVKKAEKRERKRLANERKNKNKKKQSNHSGPIIRVTIKNRTKRKFIVNINGMEKYGVKLKDAGKKLSKKYACSATVTKNAMNTKEIVMSGNIGVDIADVIHSLWDNIPIAAIIVETKKKKVKTQIPGQVEQYKCFYITKI